MPSTPGDESVSPSSASFSSVRENGESKLFRGGRGVETEGRESIVGTEGGASLSENASSHDEESLDVMFSTL